MNFYKFFTFSLIVFSSFFSSAKENNNETYNVEIIVFEQLEIIGNEKFESQKLNIDHKILYYQKRFKKDVIDSFVDYYE